MCGIYRRPDGRAKNTCEAELSRLMSKIVHARLGDFCKSDNLKRRAQQRGQLTGDEKSKL